MYTPLIIYKLYVTINLLSYRQSGSQEAIVEIVPTSGSKLMAVDEDNLQVSKHQCSSYFKAFINI